jgi:hypothetical protein
MISCVQNFKFLPKIWDVTQPHPSTLTLVFGSLDQEMDLTIGSLNIHVGSLGMIHLSDPTRSGPSAEKTVSAATSESSVGSSGKVNLAVRFKPTKNIEDTIEELDEIMENLNLGELAGAFLICCNSTSDKLTDTWKIVLELHEDDQTIFSSFSSKINHQHQVFAIIGDNSKEFEDNNYPVLNPANVTRGANHMAEGDTANSLATRAKVRLSADEWKTIKVAVNNGATIPVDASKEVLLGYHYALHRQSRQLERERSEIRKRREKVSVASKGMHEACNNASRTNIRRHNRHGSRFDNLEHSDRRNISRNHDSSFLSVNERSDIMPKTPEAALVAAQAYLYNMQPNPGDPREYMHRATLQGLCRCSGYRDIPVHLLLGHFNGLALA